MYVKYLTAKSDANHEHHQNDGGIFSELTEEKHITLRFHICFKMIYWLANTTLSINKACCTSQPSFYIGVQNRLQYNIKSDLVDWKKKSSQTKIKTYLSLLPP